MNYPKWLPFSGFRYRGEEVKEALEKSVRTGPFEDAKKMIVSSIPNYIFDILRVANGGVC